MKNGIAAKLAASWAHLNDWLSLPTERTAWHPRWREQLPQDPWSWIAAGTLGLCFVLYVVHWFNGHAYMLWDPLRQPDDIRTVVFPFHQWGPQHSLGDDPIARQMLAVSPLGWKLLYRVLVPFFDLYVTPKIVQVLCLLIIAYATYVIARSPRGGLAAGLLLCYLLLRNGEVVSTLGGGLQRGFAFPLFAVWTAGVISGRWRLRLISAAGSALFYPSAAALLLAAEGFLLLSEARNPWSHLKVHLRRYGVIIAASLVLQLPYLSQKDLGPATTLAQAHEDPGFRARLGVPPFSEAASSYAKCFVDPYTRHEGGWRVEAAISRNSESVTIMVLVVLVIAAIMAGLSPPPIIALALICASISCNALARFLAFRLYHPDRYNDYGLRMALIALLVTSVGLIFSPRRRPWVPAVRAVLVLALGGFLILRFGDGIRTNHLSINRRDQRALLDFVERLPKDVRIASHTMDGDDIPYWSGRATTGGIETVFPWLHRPWQQCQERWRDIFQLLYARSFPELSTIAKRQHVTHVLVRPHRYRADFRQRAACPPLDHVIEPVLRGLRSEQLVLAHVPKEAIVYQEPDVLLIELARWPAAARR